MKKNNQEFKRSDLPATRKELYFDILKNNKTYLLYLGIILLLSFLPYLIFNYINLASITSLLNEEDINKETILQAYIFKDAINIFLYGIIAIFLGGILKVIKILLYNEGFIFKYLFIKGIKENYKDFLKAFILFSLVFFLFDIIAINYIFLNSIVYYLMNALKILIIVPILFVLLYLCSIYSDPFLRKLKIAFIIMIKHYFKILFLLLLVLLPLCLLFINNGYVTIILMLLYFSFYLPLLLLYFGNVLNSIFDKEINQYHFKEILNKGLRKN